MMSKDRTSTGRVITTVVDPSKTEQEMAAGHEAVERYSRRVSKGKSTAIESSVFAFPISDGDDTAVTLPADIQVTIARGERALTEHGVVFKSKHTSIRPFIMSVVGQSDQERRDSNLEAREQPPKGGRRQPPMTDRLRAVMILVDHLMESGVPFGVGPKSRMNKAVREWLNEKAIRSQDPRPSRHKQITPEAVREMLKQVRAEGRAITRQAPTPKRTIQEEARERLRDLRANRLFNTD